MERRKFIKFLGKTTVAGLALSPLSLINACKSSQNLYEAKVIFDSLKVTEVIDDVILAEGFEYKVLISAGEAISNQDFFGEHNDYIALFPSKTNSNEAMMWVNHEYYSTKFLGTNVANKTQEMIDKERYAVGGSILKIKKNKQGEWQVQKDENNKRITGATQIPFLWDEKIADSHVAEGTLENCAGGFTPWGTVLTCEENYDYQYGDIFYNENNERQQVQGYAQWEKYYNNPPEHYGWVVEVDMETGEAQKIVAMGRCKHECATVFGIEDGRVVVYSGDDEANQHIYKFVSKKANSLKEGDLYVADVVNGEWLLIDYNKSEVLQSRFKNQTDVLIRLREAALMLGATPLNRPEDIEIDPISGDVFVSLTNNAAKGDFHGSILKISENKTDKTGTRFSSETFLAGGKEAMFSSPDNLVFDKRGNLWFATDISGSSLGIGEHENFLSNGLFLVPRSGKKAGEIIQVASAPVAAEFTGLCFDEINNTLFVSVQHPGETSPDLLNLTSHWPLGRNTIPKSSVIAITGKSLDKLIS